MIMGEEVNKKIPGLKAGIPVYNTYSFGDDEKTFLLRNALMVLHGPQGWSAPCRGAQSRIPAPADSSGAKVKQG
jgi:hypothetical protein